MVLDQNEPKQTHSDDQELRIWAMEQVIKMHSGSGKVLSTLTSEAEKLVEWVKGSQP